MGATAKEERLSGKLLESRISELSLLCLLSDNFSLFGVVLHGSTIPPNVFYPSVFLIQQALSGRPMPLTSERIGQEMSLMPLKYELG